MDLLIINCKQLWVGDDSTIANGPITLASYLDKQGFDVRVIDDNSQYKRHTFQDYKSFIQKNQPEIVGLSVNTLNAYNSYNLAKELKHVFPDLILIAGGLHSYDVSDEMIMRDFDIVFKGEAELALCKFLKIKKDGNFHKNEILKNDDFIRKITKVSGLLIKTGKEIIKTGESEIIKDLDEIPFINMDLLNLDDYQLKTEFDFHGVTDCFNFQRGCPYRCTYCNSGGMPDKIRNNSAQYMFKEIKYRYEKYRFTHFSLLDSNFTLGKERLKEFCSLMISSGISKEITFNCQSSIAITLADDEIELLKKAGLTMISYGVERFDNNFRKLMKKAGKGEQAIALIKKTHDHGLKIMLNILINFPYETEESLDKEARLVDECLKYVNFLHVLTLIPIPGTEVFEKDSDYSHWYLRRDLANYRLSFYEIIYSMMNPSLVLNPFKHPPGLVRKMKIFKERFYKKGMMQLNRSYFFRIALTVSICLAKISYFTYKISPILEHFIFYYIKFIRAKLYKRFAIKYAYGNQ